MAHVSLGLVLVTLETGLVNNPALSVVWARHISLPSGRSSQITSPRVSRTESNAIG